jgi:hypothetical protein
MGRLTAPPPHLENKTHLLTGQGNPSPQGPLFACPVRKGFPLKGDTRVGGFVVENPNRLHREVTAPYSGYLACKSRRACLNSPAV